MMQNALTGNMTVEEAVNDAAAKIDSVVNGGGL